MVHLAVESPFRVQDLKRLSAGDIIYINGIIFTARDAAHRKLVKNLESGEHLPFALAGQTLYYMGPTPARPGTVIGACGPTTSGRMDAYTPQLLENGLRAMIGKGSRSAAVRTSMLAHQAIYLVTFGGAGALLSQHVKTAEVVAYPELGAEAVFRLEVQNFPVIVVNDIYGADLLDIERAKYAC